MKNLTINSVELEVTTYENSFDKKRYFEYYIPTNSETKMFINQSLSSGKTLKVSAFIDGVQFSLAEKYDISMALDIFTNLISKFSPKHLEVSK